MKIVAVGIYGNQCELEKAIVEAIRYSNKKYEPVCLIYKRRHHIIQWGMYGKDEESTIEKITNQFYDLLSINTVK